MGHEKLQFVSPYPSMGQRDEYQSEDVTPALSASQAGHIDQGQGVGQGRPQELQAESSSQARQMTCYHCLQPGNMRLDCPRRKRSHGAETERSDQSDEQSTFLLSHLLIRVAFELDASCSFINTSCVIGLGIEVEAFRKAVI